jgi:uncharacterized protein DUF4383
LGSAQCSWPSACSALFRITANHDHLTVAGHHSDAALLGSFTVSVVHNLVHLAFGAAGIALARTFNRARSYSSVGALGI